MESFSNNIDYIVNNCDKLSTCLDSIVYGDNIKIDYGVISQSFYDFKKLTKHDPTIQSVISSFKGKVKNISEGGFLSSSYIIDDKIHSKLVKFYSGGFSRTNSGLPNFLTHTDLKLEDNQHNFPKIKFDEFMIGKVLDYYTTSISTINGNSCCFSKNSKFNIEEVRDFTNVDESYYTTIVEGSIKLKIKNEALKKLQLSYNPPLFSQYANEANDQYRCLESRNIKLLYKDILLCDVYRFDTNFIFSLPTDKSETTLQFKNKIQEKVKQIVDDFISEASNISDANNSFVLDPEINFDISVDYIGFMDSVNSKNILSAITSDSYKENIDRVSKVCKGDKSIVFYFYDSSINSLDFCSDFIMEDATAVFQSGLLAFYESIADIAVLEVTTKEYEKLIKRAKLLGIDFNHKIIMSEQMLYNNYTE